MAETEFDRWQQRFAAPGYLFGTAPNEFLKSQGKLLRQGQSALAIADVGYVIQTGRVVMHGPAHDLLHDEAVKKAYLGH